MRGTEWNEIGNKGNESQTREHKNQRGNMKTQRLNKIPSGPMMYTVIDINGKTGCTWREDLDNVNGASGETAKISKVMMRKRAERVLTTREMILMMVRAVEMRM